MIFINNRYLKDMKFSKITFIIIRIIIIVFPNLVNIFSDTTKIQIRQCCICNSCKEKDISDKIITNKEVKKVGAIDATKFTYTNEKGEQLEVIAENKEEKKNIISELNSKGIKDNNIKEEHIYIPKEEYFDNKKSIASTSKDQITTKIEKCSTEDGKEEVKFETLTNICTEAINELERIHNSTHSKKEFLADDTTKGLNYHYIRYITRGNVVKEIKNILFDLEKKNNYWKIKQIINNSTNNGGDKIENTNVDVVNKKITFDRITNDMLTCVHEVTNIFRFTNSNSDDFTCRVESIAKYSSEKSKKIKKPKGNSNYNFLSNVLNSTKKLIAEGCNLIPDIYTDIIYKCKYDKSTNSTFFITIGIFHYPEVNDPFRKVIKTIKKQAHDVFTLLLGENFSNELKKASTNNKIKSYIHDSKSIKTIHT